MSETRKLVFAIVKFLKNQLHEGGLSPDCAEGVEVGIQCLEAAYEMSPSEPSLDVPCGLQEIFQNYLANYQEQLIEPTAEERAQAEVLKREGNVHMNEQNYREALASYTKAIKLNPRNAVYYCNRAAASQKLNHFENAVRDCKAALKIDPTYSKAHCRLGLAYSCLNLHQDSFDSYKRAFDLEPDNESYKSNLKSAEESLQKSLPFQNLDLSMVFTNPNLLTMATQMLSNPHMQNMMANVFSGNGSAETPGVDYILQASQQLAQRLETENPHLVEQLRDQMAPGSSRGRGGGGGDAGGDVTPPPPPPKPESDPEPEGPA